jgi:cytochrome c peroxidase
MRRWGVIQMIRRPANHLGIAASIAAIATLTFLLAATAAFAQSSADQLMGMAKSTFGALPKSMPSAANPITAEKVALGRILYFEPRISVDGTVSCSRCHLIGLYATDGLPKAIGDNCKLNPRNAPTVFNAADQIAEHWIGNRKSVEDQATQALVGPPSFGMPSYEAAVKALQAIPGYAALFAAAFPRDADPVTAPNFGDAVGAFERTLVTPGPLDDFIGGDAAALSTRQQQGMMTFIEQGCAGCHSSTYLGGQHYIKFGIVAPYWQYTKSKIIDEGRYAVTNNPADKYVFKVPVLRNVAMTPPYFHDGSVPMLSEAIWIMAKVQEGKDLTGVQVGDILAFFDALTGRIPTDALQAPILPPREPIDIGEGSK